MAQAKRLVGSEGNYTQYYPVEAEGQRIGLASCRTCGAVVLLGDPAFDAFAAHETWHMKHGERRLGLARKAKT